MISENSTEKELIKELRQLNRKYKKLELDYTALALRHDQTERLRNFNEAAKELSNFYNRLLLINTPSITFMLNRELRFVLGSEKTAAFLGCRDIRVMVDAPISEMFANKISDEWVDAMNARCADVIEKNSPIAYEEEVVINNEGAYVFQITIAPAVEVSGECRGVVVIMNDITELKQAEADLEKRLLQQSLMAALSQNFISNSGKEVQINSALQMAGEFMDVSRIMLVKFSDNVFYYQYEWCTPSGNVNPKRGTVLHLDAGDAPVIDAFAAKRISHYYPDEEERTDIITRYGLSDVESFLMLPIYLDNDFWGVLKFDQCEKYIKWTSSDINLGVMIGGILSGAITRQHMEQDLLKMSSIINSAPQYIAYINPDGNFDFLNPASTDVTGYSHDELIENGIQILYSDETNERIINEIMPKIFSYGKYEFELPLIRKDGEERIVSFSAFTINSDEYGCGTIASDVTQQKILEKQLIEAKELAEKNSSAKSEFLSRMSHEMRTPLNAIIGMTTIAKGSADIERKDYCLDKIDSASTHLLGVINDVLDMSKIEAGKFELSYTDFSIEKMLIKITNVINFRMEEKELNFLVKISPDVPQNIVSDEQRLNQVITNLLSNAVKFTPKNGNITLFVRKLAEGEGCLTVQFEVKDTGIGISDEQQRRLFRSFEQADGSVSRKYGGTGLGLAISKAIVEMMDGKIWVESEPGEGSSFIFNILVERGVPSEEPVSIEEIDWKNLSVLVVDDAPDILEYFLSIADSLGLKCETAESGVAACELIESRGPFNIIFVDWKMPEMDGITLTRIIKERYGSNTVVIMISATEWSHIENDARSAGVDRFIPKPLFSSVIVDCIYECLAIQQTKAEEETVGSEENIFKGKRVLLAEDVEVNREIVMTILEPTGIQIDCAENGRIAFEMFAKDPGYDMIFMDIHMPEVSGYESTKMIREFDDPRAKTVPVIAMTANVFREDIEKCLEAGMNAHVGKPLDFDEVIEKLKQYLL